MKPHEFYDFRKTGAILHELAMADWWRAFMAKIRFWAEELRQASILSPGELFRSVPDISPWRAGVSP